MGSVKEVGVARTLVAGVMRLVEVEGGGGESVGAAGGAMMAEHVGTSREQWDESAYRQK